MHTLCVVSDGCPGVKLITLLDLCGKQNEFMRRKEQPGPHKQQEHCAQIHDQLLHGSLDNLDVVYMKQIGASHEIFLSSMAVT